MNKFRLFILLSLIFTISAAAFGQNVVITKKKETVKRPRPTSEYKASFDLERPVVKAATPAVSRLIEQNLSYEKNFELSIKEETTDIQWLDEATFEIEHNGGGIISARLSISGSAAYPDGVTKYVVLDAKTGRKLTANDVFIDLSGLLKLVLTKQEAEVKEASDEIKDEDPEVVDYFDGRRIDVEGLDHFSVSADGVAFHYDYAFPHVIQAYEPEGKFEFTWAEIKGHIKPSGLLGRFVR